MENFHKFVGSVLIFTPMKSRFTVAMLAAMLLAMFCCIQLHAQNLLDNLEPIPITKMETWLLVVKNGKPHYKALDASSLHWVKYTLHDVEYEHPDGVEPFMFTTAVATFKANEGYYFDKKLQLDIRVPQAENTTGFKRIDAKTVKVYLTAFTGKMGYDVRITPAMKEYKNKISNLFHFLYTHTAS